jgi:hypothetical protein
MNRDGTYSNLGLRRAIGARALRDTLSGRDASSAGRRERFQFPCLKRLSLPRQALSHGFAPNA